MKVASSGKASLAISTKAGNDQTRAYLEAIASLFEHGVKVNLEKLLSKGPSLGKRRPLPTYPFQRQRHYPDFVPSRKNGRVTARSLAVPNVRVDAQSPMMGDVQSLSSSTPSLTSHKTKEDISETVTHIIKNVLELESSEPLGQCHFGSNIDLSSLPSNLFCIGTQNWPNPRHL